MLIRVRMLCLRAGHTSWSTSGLGYLTLWLLGKLNCFDGQAQPTRLVVAFVPLLGEQPNMLLCMQNGAVQCMQRSCLLVVLQEDCSSSRCPVLL